VQRPVMFPAFGLFGRIEESAFIHAAMDHARRAIHASCGQRMEDVSLDLDSFPSAGLHFQPTFVLLHEGS
jgi:hypothetical protein